MSEMGIPPQMLEALMGAQGGGGPAPPGMASPPAIDPAMLGGEPPMEEPAPEQGPLYGGGGGDNVEALRAALDMLQQYAGEEDDEQNIQVVLKCVTQLQAILAEEQKMSDGLMSGKADPRSLRRAGAAQGASEEPY